MVQLNLSVVNRHYHLNMATTLTMASLHHGFALHRKFQVVHAVVHHMDILVPRITLTSSKYLGIDCSFLAAATHAFSHRITYPLSGDCGL